MEAAISLVMIVKNEAANLPVCLDSVNGQVDEIIIVDTGSIDGTCAAARRYTDKIYHFAWCNDFSAAKNFAIGKAAGEWILSLDADEELISGTGDLRGLAAGAEHGAYLLPMDIPSMEGSGGYNRLLALRFFKNRERYRYRGRIHEAVHDSENGLVGVVQGPLIRHKMVTLREGNCKRGRNLALLKKVCVEDPDDYFLQYCLGTEWMALGKPEQALPPLRQACQNLAGNSPLYHTAALNQLINCLKTLGRHDEALYVCREGINCYPGYADLYYHCGMLYIEEKDYRRALEWFEQAVKCGAPPALHSHQDGTESFLALHSMGYCHELLGSPEQALQSYRQALDVNPAYAYPANNLCMLLCAECGPGHALQYFMEEGLLGNKSIALTAGNLFFTWGYPGLARRCLEIYLNSWEADEYLLLNLGKYSTFSGKPVDGMNYFNLIPKECALYPDARLYGTIALLLAGRYEEARGRALGMWKSRDRRRAVLALKLGRFMEKGGDICCPGAVDGADTADAAMQLYGECCLYLPEGSDYANHSIFILLAGLEVVLKGSSRGCLSLIEYYRGKYHQGEQFFNYKINLGQKIQAG